MSADPPPKLSANWLRQTTEAIESFISWVAELIHRRNWFTLLILVAVVLSSTSILLRETISAWLPDRYETAVWTGVIAVTFFACFCALVVATTTKKHLRQRELPVVTERKAIKGLRPFGSADSVIFSRLQRHQTIRECLDAITSSSYRFGILIGDSGCGKTSFLKAGLLARLPEVPDSPKGVYVQFSDEPPLQSIQRSLSNHLQPSPKIKEGTSFLEMMRVAEKAVGAPLLIVLDQFEQFFVHNTTEISRQVFIESLAAWYSDLHSSSTKVLISVRSDLAYQVYSIQKVLGCTLGPQDSFILRKFTPSESAQVLSVIAETEHLRCDRKFLEEISEQELANDEDGLVSPVDLQIFAWMIDRQGAEDLRAFNREAFQKFGGVDGLLNRFLDRALSSLPLSTQRQAAIKVMLALADLERQVRVGFLTLPQLQRKVRGSVKPEEVVEAVRWLSQSNVRLITSSKPYNESIGLSTNTISYELAHERIIPVLMQLAGEKLTQLDKVNQLLERRVNEWIGNERNPRFLLTLPEVWSVRKRRPYIVLGKRADQKKALIEPI